jgi:hypothetical protein
VNSQAAQGNWNLEDVQYLVELVHHRQDWFLDELTGLILVTLDHYPENTWIYALVFLCFLCWARGAAAMTVIEASGDGHSIVSSSRSILSRQFHACSGSWATVVDPEHPSDSDSDSDSGLEDARSIISGSLSSMYSMLLKDCENYHREL